MFEVRSSKFQVPSSKFQVPSSKFKVPVHDELFEVAHDVLGRDPDGVRGAGLERIVKMQLGLAGLLIPANKQDCRSVSGIDISKA
jgi:hypothetical protein